MTSWLDLLMQQTSELESPRRYFYFAGLSVLSAIAKRNVYLDRGGAYKLYPNLYVMLVGKSGIKKGLPVATAEKLVKDLKCTKVISGRSSIQAIIEHLGHQEMKADGSVEKSAPGFVVSGEFSQSILEDNQALTILTNLYDGQYNDEFINLLKSGKSVLKNVYLAMLGASNETHLAHVIRDRDIHGGFIARTLIVNENERGKKNSLVYKIANPINYEQLSEHLKGILGLRGEFLFDPQAAEFYDDWYNEYEPEQEDETGTSNRITDTILKVAMLLSLARDYSLILTTEDIQKSIEVCFGCYKAARKLTVTSQSTTSASLANEKKIFIQSLLDAPGNRMERVKMLQKNYLHFGALELNSIVDSLEQGKIIRQEKGVNGSIFYILEPYIVEKYQEYYAKLKEKG